MARSDSLADGRVNWNGRATTSLEFWSCSGCGSEHLWGGGWKMEGRRVGKKKETTRRLETEGKEEGVCVWKGENMRGYQYHIHSQNGKRDTTNLSRLSDHRTIFPSETRISDHRTSSTEEQQHDLSCLSSSKTLPCCGVQTIHSSSSPWLATPLAMEETSRKCKKGSGPPQGVGHSDTFGFQSHVGQM